MPKRRLNAPAIAGRIEPDQDREIKITNNEASKAAPILAIGVMVALGIFVGWHALVFVFAQTGLFRDPAQALARALVGLAIGWIVLMAISYIVGDKIREFYRHRERLADLRIEEARIRQKLLNSAIIDTGIDGDGKRFAGLVLSVMIEVYDYLASNDEYRGTARPWSRRQAAQVILPGESKPVGQTMAEKLRPWLEHHDIIIDDQVNTLHYPDLNSVQRLLRKPILLANPDLPDEGPTEWSIID